MLRCLGRFHRGATTLLFDEPANAHVPSTFGPYRVLHQIGSGVLGPVFRTHDARHDRIVAVKAFALDLLPESVDALAESLRALARTAPEHRAAVSVIDAGLEGYTPYLAMAFEAGETLDQVIRRGEAGAFDRLAACVSQLAEVIDRFSDEGCRHGALHPRDVFVTASGLSVRVTGFGVSQALAAAGITWPGRRPYAAPERTGGDWDTRADVYALGAIAHELLTGRRPIGAGEQDGEFGPDITLNQRPRLRRVLATALAARPEDRFATAGELAAALAEALGRTLAPAVPQSAEPHVTSVPARADASAPVLPVAREETLAFDFDVESLDVDEHRPADLLLRLEPVAPEDARIDSAHPWESAHAWEEEDAAVDTPSPDARRPWDGLAAVALAGLALGALIVVAGVRVSGPEGTEPVAPVSAASIDAPTAEAPTASIAPAAPAAAASAPEPAAAPASSPPGRATAAETAADGPAPPLAARGRLHVESDPAGALVTIDGRLWGATPVTALDLPLGSHLVQVARPGFAPAQSRVTLTAAAPTQQLRLSLEPGLPQTGATPRTGPSGAIDVDSRPRGARVSIDGRFVGNAPLRLADLEPGTHALTLELSGYSGASRRVQVQPGEVARLVVSLE